MLADQGQGEVNLIKNSKMLYYNIFPNSFFFWEAADTNMLRIFWSNSDGAGGWKRAPTTT